MRWSWRDALVGVLVLAVIGAVTVLLMDLGQQRPDVIVVSMDTLRSDRLGVYGNEEGLTPNIDRFADDATVFSTAVAQDAWTLSSEYSIALSQYPGVHGVTSYNASTPHGVTLAERLQRAGYDTLGLYRPYGGVRGQAVYDQGFGTYRFTSGFDAAFNTTLDWLAGRQDPAFAYLMAKDIHAPYDGVPDRYTDPVRASYTSELEHFRLKLDSAGFGSDVLGRVRRNATGFFLIEQHNGDRIRRGTVLERFGVGSVADLDPFVRQRLEPLNATHLRVVSRGRTVFLDQQDIAYVRAMYDAGVRYVDALFGRFIERLKERGLYEDTMIVVLSNHGEDLGEHRIGVRDGLWFGHWLPYRHTTEVPLLIRYPGQDGSRRVDGLVELVDVAPTVLETALGVQDPPGMQGLSLVGVGADGPDREYAFSKSMMVRNETWKLIRRKDRPDQLFDLRADPGETTSVVDEHPQIYDDLSARLRDHRLAVSAFRTGTVDPVG